MKLVAVGMVKDEADVIERTLWNVAAQGADHICLFDNASTDATASILRGFNGRVGRSRLDVWTDWEVGYYQSRKMTELATYARVELGADWVWPFDADELWTWPAGPVREALEAAPLGVGVVESHLFNHYVTSLDPPGHPFDSMQWRDPAPLGLPKIIARAVPGLIIDAGNHSARLSPLWARVDLGLIVHHYPYRSAEQFIRKVRNGAAAYAATDLSADTGRHWREYGAALAEHGESALEEHYRRHFVYDDPVVTLVRDPAAWPDTLPT